MLVEEKTVRNELFDFQKIDFYCDSIFTSDWLLLFQFYSYLNIRNVNKKNIQGHFQCVKYQCEKICAPNLIAFDWIKIEM